MSRHDICCSHSNSACCMQKEETCLGETTVEVSFKTCGSASRMSCFSSLQSKLGGVVLKKKEITCFWIAPNPQAESMAKRTKTCPIEASCLTAASNDDKTVIIICNELARPLRLRRRQQPQSTGFLHVKKSSLQDHNVQSLALGKLAWSGNPCRHAHPSGTKLL